MAPKSPRRSAKKMFGVVIISVVLCLLIILLPMVSCTPKQVIGRLLICAEIDGQTFEPLDIGNEYSIDSEQILAAVKVAGVRGSDEWHFIWKNADTGEIIADSTNIYSPDRSSFMEGYLLNKLIPGENGTVIAEPGNYTVSYYHNEDLRGTAGFKIMKPEVSILEAGFYRDIDGRGEPVDVCDVFSQKDIIYMGVKVDYKIEDDSYKIKWFAGDEFLGEEDIIINKSYYMPGYIVFQLMNKDQKPFPVDRYRVQLFYNDRMLEEYFFEINAEEFTDKIFSGEALYQNDEFGFTAIYPDGWSLIEENLEEGPRVKFIPEDGVRQIEIEMWVLKKNYSPAAGQYSAFADELMIKKIEQEDESGIEKTEGEKTVGDMEIFEVKYDKWKEADNEQSMTFSFFKKNNMLFLFMRLTDTVYIDYGEKVVDTMINSIGFTE
ncbi:MAG TPA: hypothetical protein DCP02_07310 [Actinobacteria bacterium]|nr:hypothetical protein [Actinomycetota bacterium]